MTLKWIKSSKMVVEIERNIFWFQPPKRLKLNYPINVVDLAPFDEKAKCLLLSKRPNK